MITFEDDLFQTKFYGLEYDFELTREKMSTDSLPLAYFETLSSGILDSTEVLNETEALLTGEELGLEGLAY